jgi:hypothetical protein
MQIKPTVAVLLATYKPFPYIVEQIESLRFQEDVDLTVFWGDDGSSLIEINELESLLEGMAYKKFSFDHVGASQNFINLLKNAEGFQYYAFCDQDDVWDRRKLISQINLIDSTPEEIRGVHSHPDLMKNGKIRVSKVKCTVNEPKFFALTNCCQGCTLLINSRARIATLEDIPNVITWHDWYVALVIVSRGKLLKSDASLVKYRLHSNNAIGTQSLIKKILRIIFGVRGLRVAQITFLLSSQGHKMNPDIKMEFKEILDSFSGSAINRFRFLLRIKKIRNSRIEDFAFKLRCFLITP